MLVFVIAPLILITTRASLDRAFAEEDEIFLLQTWSGLNWNDGYVPAIRPLAQPSLPGPVTSGMSMMQQPMPQLEQSGLAPVVVSAASAMPAVAADGIPLVPQPMSLAMTTMQRQLQQLQTTAQVADTEHIAAQATAEVVRLQKMVQDLHGQSEAQEGKLTNAQEELRQEAIKMQEARESAAKAWEQDKVLKNEIRKLVDERAKFVERFGDGYKVDHQKIKALELLATQAKESERKAWKQAKLQAEKASAERKTKERLLAEARDELESMKIEVSRVREQVKSQLQTEIKQAKNEVAEEVETLKHEADARLEREHEQVTSLTEWASKVQKEADTKLKWAKDAQEAAANQVNWAKEAQQEAARAATAIEKVAKVHLAKAKKEDSNGKGHSTFGFTDTNAEAEEGEFSSEPETDERMRNDENTAVDSSKDQT